MTNDADDLFGLALEREASTVELAYGLRTPASIPAADLETVELAYRNADRACHAIVFVETDEATGEDVFANGVEWMEILAFPRLPTLDEVAEWQRWHDARLEAMVYYALEADRMKPKKPAVPTQAQAQPSTRSPVEPGPTRGPTA